MLEMLCQVKADGILPCRFSAATGTYGLSVSWLVRCKISRAMKIVDSVALNVDMIG